MNNEKRNEIVNLDSLLKLLSDAEIASVSTAESAPHLENGEEFVDLQRLDRGVRRAFGAKVPMGRILPRKAVRAATWEQIVKQLAVAREAAQMSRL